MKHSLIEKKSEVILFTNHRIKLLRVGISEARMQTDLQVTFCAVQVQTSYLDAAPNLIHYLGIGSHVFSSSFSPLLLMNK